MNAHVDRKFNRLRLYREDPDGEMEVKCIFPYLVHNVPMKYAIRLTKTHNVVPNYRRAFRLMLTKSLSAVRNFLPNAVRISPNAGRNYRIYTTMGRTKSHSKIVVRLLLLLLRLIE